MNLEIDGTKKILLVEESQGLTLNTEANQIRTVVGNVGPQGPAGPQGPQGVAGDVSKDDFYKSLAANPDQLIFGTITRATDGVISTASVTWPDGTPGTFTVTGKDSNLLVINAYTITYGTNPIMKTYTQGLITRNADGAVITRPAIGVSL